jgi:hypothetical protein
MIIPTSKRARDDAVCGITDVCLSSRRDRDLLYLNRKRFLDYGTSDYTLEVKYNRLQAHTDLVSAFLYSADHCRYAFAAPRNSDDGVMAQIEALEDEWNATFRDCGLANMYADAVYWSLGLEASFIKLGWNDARDDLFGKLILPSSFGVYDESEPDIDSQEAFVHSYNLNWDNAVQRLKRAGLSSKIKSMRAYPGPYDEDLPPILTSLIIDATGGPNIGGAMLGRASPDFQPRATYQANTENRMARFHETWVWDDAVDDYAVFVKVDGIDDVLSDSRQTIEVMRKADPENIGARYRGQTNLFGIEQEHPFVPVIPYRRPDYFWGECHSDRLIPLQIWTNERLQQITDLLEQNVDPPKVGSGLMGTADEKIDALGGPGTWVMEQLPNAKVEMLRPPVTPDLFNEFREIGSIFLEASGLTEMLMGHGEQGVRGEKQAKKMMVTGSGRIRKVAVGLEESLVKLAEIGVKLIQRNSTNRMRTDTGQVLLPAQVAERRNKIRVAGHSHSPLFADESKDQALLLHKVHAIDREMLIRMLNPPNADALIHRLRKMVKAEQAEKEKQAAAGVKPGGGKARPHAVA